MFTKQSLKDRFLSAESKLDTTQSDSHRTDTKNPESIQLEKSKHPALHALVRGTEAEEEDLSFYLRSLKNKFKRVSVPALTYAQAELEEEFCKTINTFAPNCLIQFHHPKDEKSVETAQLFINAMEEQANSWSLILKNMKWLGVNFNAPSATLTFEADHIEAAKLEGILKSACFKSGSLISFKVQRKDSNFLVNLRLENNKNNSISSSRDASI